MRTIRYMAAVVGGMVGLMVSADAQPNRPKAAIETSNGRIVIELYQDEAPRTVANFMKLANQGFYT